MERRRYHSTEERVLITQSMKEVNQIMEAYVGIVRSNTRLTRAWNRLDILYEETEALFKRSKATRELCETTQHDKRRIPDNKASHGTQGKPRTALHDRLSARREVTKVKLAPLYWHGKRTWSFKQSARMLSSEHPGVSRYPYLHKQETLSIV